MGIILKIGDDSRQGRRFCSAALHLYRSILAPDAIDVWRRCLQSQAEALVNTVNTVGVMGKGIALQFREAFPHNYKKYQEACKKKELQPGVLLVVWDNNLQSGQKLIVNFPTKVHWRNPSQYEYIEKGLDALRDLLLEKSIKSIAIPALGSGNGAWTGKK